MITSIKTKAHEGRNKFEFTMGIRKEEHTFRAASQEDLDEWVKMIKRGMAMCRPLHLGVSSHFRRKNRESKFSELDVWGRPRLSTAKSNMVKPSLTSESSVPYSSVDPPIDPNSRKD